MLVVNARRFGSSSPSECREKRMPYCKGGGDWLLEKIKEPIMLLEGEFAIKTWGKR